MSSTWSQREEEILIDFYGNHEGLHNKNHKDYNYSRKSKLLAELVRKLNAQAAGKKFSVDDVLAQWNQLRNEYNKQKRQVQKNELAKPKASKSRLTLHIQPVHEPNWIWWDAMSSVLGGAPDSPANNLNVTLLSPQPSEKPSRKTLPPRKLAEYETEEVQIKSEPSPPKITRFEAQVESPKKPVQRSSRRTLAPRKTTLYDEDEQVKSTPQKLSRSETETIEISRPTTKPIPKQSPKPSRKTLAPRKTAIYEDDEEKIISTVTLQKISPFESEEEQINSPQKTGGRFDNQEKRLRVNLATKTLDRLSIAAKKRVKSVESPNMDMEIESVEEPNSPEPNTSAKRERKRKIDVQESVVSVESNSSPAKCVDECTSTGMFVESRLRACNEFTRKTLIFKIHELFYNEECSPRK